MNAPNPKPWRRWRTAPPAPLSTGVLVGGRFIWISACVVFLSTSTAAQQFAHRTVDGTLHVAPGRIVDVREDTAVPTQLSGATYKVEGDTVVVGNIRYVLPPSPRRLQVGPYEFASRGADGVVEITKEEPPPVIVAGSRSPGYSYPPSRQSEGSGVLGALALAAASFFIPGPADDAVAITQLAAAIGRLL